MVQHETNITKTPQNAATAVIQAKLTVGAVDDPMEIEADQMADRVMRMPDTAHAAANIQRKCAHCEEEEKVQRKELPSFLQRKETTGTVTASEGVQSGIADTKGKGDQMDPGTRSFMERGFGADFAGVNIHSDASAAAMNRELGARAFTVGSDIYFNDNQYNPASSDGKRLLAHELTHTMQQAGFIRRDKDKTPKVEDDADLLALRKNITEGKWKEAYTYLQVQWMKIMLEKLHALTEPELDLLIANADAARDAKDSNIGEGGKNRTLAGVWAAKAFKNTALSDADLELAKQKALTVPYDQRKEIVDYLKPGTSKAAKKLRITLNKPFLGYTASAYDFSDRFLRQSDKLGFDVESSTRTLPTTAWTGDDPDPQLPATTDEATKSFEKSDIVFFSGHQYAQYKRPGLYTNDASDSCFNMGAISKKLNKVKLVASTSCATICKDVARIYKDKFPNALVLGYKYSAPLNGALVSNSFSDNLVKKGPVDLNSPAGLGDVRDAWKKATTSNPGTEGAPGILFGDDVEYYGGGKWKTAKADSKENECHYH